jgi:tetratricopeptide (TPR) repeat protein
LQVLGELERSGKHLEEAERLAKAGGDPRQLARVYSFMAQYFRLTGDPSRAVQSGERALATAERLDDSPLRDLANGMLGAVYISRGDYRKSAEILRRSQGRRANCLRTRVSPDWVRSSGAFI